MPHIIQLGILDGRCTSASRVNRRNARHLTSTETEAAAGVKLKLKDGGAVQRSGACGELFVSGVRVQANCVGLKDGYRSARNDFLGGRGAAGGMKPYLPR